MLLHRMCISALVFHLVLFKITLSQSIVKTLPGFAGTLPFKLETGYVGVGENEEVQLFYYFIESERDPEKDPLVLWHTGGPGCSVFSGLVYEIGPLSIDLEASNHTSLSFRLNQYAWTKIANIIFLDLPVGTGFTYSTTSKGYNSSDTKATRDSYNFLQKWFSTHPQFINNRLYIGGDSYAGKLVPLIVLEISKGNEAGLKPSMSVEGYLLGNPGMEPEKDLNWRLPYAHRFALISDESFEQAERSCQGEYVNPTTNNTECFSALEQYKECTRNIFGEHILEPICKPSLDLLKWNPTFLQYDDDYFVDFFSQSSINIQGTPVCRHAAYASSYAWANDPKVREALNVRKGTKGAWTRCNHSVLYDQDVPSVFYHHQLLTGKPYQALVYSGDHDMAIPYIGTLDWVRRLNLSIDEDWRPWLVDGQNAGYTVRYKENQFYLTFATVKAAGHTAPEYKPKECFAMVNRWFSYYPL